MDIERRYLKRIDWAILLILVALAAYSYIGISGANAQFGEEKKQLIWYAIGFGAMFAVLLFDYKWIGQLAYGLYGFGIVLLVLVLLFGTETNGAVSWFAFGPVKIQPSEFMKIFLILALARYLTSREEEGDAPLQSASGLLGVFGLVALPIVLILMQPDLGTALVFCGILLSVLLVGGAPLRVFSLLGLIGATGFGLLAFLYAFHSDVFFKIVKPYQFERILAWLNPDYDPLGSGFQLKQSLIAIGSGQLFGRGLNGPTQARYGWVPEGQTDFVFTVIAERLGFLGASVLILLFFLLIYRLVRIGMTCKDPFGAYIVAGIVGMYVFQVFENIGMTIQLMPITGIPLPFLSYGGSSLLTNLVTIGLVLNIHMRRRELIFD